MSLAFDQEGRWDGTKAHRQQVQQKRRKPSRDARRGHEGLSLFKSTDKQFDLQRSLCEQATSSTDNPGDAPPVPQVTGFGSPQCVGNEICSLPLSKQLGLCLLFVTWTRTMDGKHSLQEGSSAGTALVQLFLTAQRACRRGLGFFPPLCFVHF